MLLKTQPKPRTVLVLLGALVTAVFCACSKAPPGAPNYKEVALQFAQALAERDYDAAYALTSREYRSQTSLEQMQADFETIVPLDWGPVEPVEAAMALKIWPGKQANDLGWVYVSIGGEVYSEALVAVVTSEEGQPKVRAVEFGRP